MGGGSGFPAMRTHRKPGWGEVRRHHVHETVVQREVKAAWPTQVCVPGRV